MYFKYSDDTDVPRYRLSSSDSLLDYKQSSPDLTTQSDDNFLQIL